MSKKLLHKFHTDAKDSEDGIAKYERYIAKVISQVYYSIYVRLDKIHFIWGYRPISLHELS